MPVMYLGSHVPLNQLDWELAFIKAGFAAADVERLLRYPEETPPLVLRVSAEAIEPLHHVVYRSPTGLEWGYAGSGPADLARSLLADHLNLTSDANGELRDADGNEVVVPDQQFKDAVVARLPRRAFAISRNDIDLWLATHAAPGGSTAAVG